MRKNNIWELMAASLQGLSDGMEAGFAMVLLIFILLLANRFWFISIPLLIILGLTPKK